MPSKQPPPKPESLKLTDKEPSLLFALQELIRTDGINFEEWWDEFRLGFPNGKRDVISNFKTAEWVRPRYRNLTPVESKSGAMTIEFWPDNDKLNTSYLLSGTHGAIIKAIMEILRDSKNNQDIFKQWFEEWENGFDDFKENRANSNFPVSGKKQWERIKNIQSRPRYRDWLNPEQQKKSEYRIIEYWRDRSKEDNSILLSGTDLQLIQHIIQIEYEGGGSNSGIKAPSDEISNKGLPIIRLYFEQDKDKILKKPNGKPYSPLRGEVTLRLVGKSEDPNSSLDKLTKSDISKYAENIKNLFGTNNGYVWGKGKKIVAYNKPEDGFKRTWYLCKTHKDGIELLTKLVQVTNKQLDRTRITKSEVDNESGRFPDRLSPIIVLGDQVEQKRERMTGEVRFLRAELILAKLTKPIELVKKDKVTYKA